MPTADVNRKSDTPTNVDYAAEVYEKNGDFIRSAIRFHVKNEAEAEDLFQDLFLFLISKPILQEVQNVKGFLYRLICDRTKDASKRIDRYQAMLRRYAKRNVRVIQDSPENVLMNTEETKKMLELIEERLAPPQALAVTSRYKDDCGTAEIAKRMGVKPTSVSSYVSVGLRKVRNALRKKQGGNYDSR